MEQNYFFKLRKILATIFSIAFVIINANAATQTWTGTTSSDWTVASNWGGTAPVAGDIANIPGGLSTYPIINNTITIATVNINSSGSGATITVTTGGTFNITSALNVNANGSLIISGGNIYSQGNLTINNGGTVNQSGGLIHMAVNIGTNPTDHLLIATGGTYTQSDGTLHVDDWTAGGGTFNQTGSNALFKIFHDWEPGAGSVFNSTAGTVQFTGAPAGSNFAAGSRQFSNIIVDAGIDPGFSELASSTISLTGNFTNNNTTLNVTTNATFTFNGTGAQTITSAVTGSTNATFGSLVLNNPTTITLASNINIAGNLTIQQGTFDESSYNSNRSTAGGTLTMTGNAYLKAGSAYPTNWTTNTLNSGTTVEFNGSGSETIPALNYATVISSGSGARVLASSGTIGISETFTKGTNSYTITGSTINFNGSGSQTVTAFNYNNLTSSSSGARTLASSGTIGIAGTFTPGTNSYTITGSTINFNGSVAQTITAFDYNNLTSSSSGARTLASTGTIGISATFTVGSNSYITTGSTVEFKGSGSQTIPAFSYNHLISSNSGARTLSSMGAINIAGNFTTGSNSYTITGSQVNLNGSGAQSIGAMSFNNLSTSTGGTKSTTGDITVNGTLTVNASTTLSPGAAYIVAGSGTLTGTGKVEVTRVTGTPDLLNQYTITNKTLTGLNIDYIGAGAQTVNALNYGNLTISTNGTRTVTLANSGTIGVAGDFSATATTTTYVVTGSTIDFNGSGAQSVPAFTFNNLTTSNAGVKSTSGNIVVNGILTVSSPTTLSPGAANTIGGSGTITGTGIILVTRIAVTADFLNQYTITNKTLTNLTVDYTGAGAQTINNTLGNYSTLKISGSGTKSLQGAITITGDLIINAGTLDVTASNYGISIGGNWTNNVAAANFTQRSGTVTFNGTGAQAINGSAASQTFNNIIVSKTAGQTLSISGSTTAITLNDFTETTGNFTGPATVTINGNFLLSAGTYTNGTTTSIGGSWTNNGGSIAGSGTVSFTGAAQTIGGSATTSFPTLSVTGTIILNTNASATAFIIPANATASSLTLASGITFTVNGDITVNQPTASVIAVINVNTGTLIANGNVNIGGNNTTGGRIAKIVLTTGLLDIVGNLVYNSAASTPANAVIDLSGGAGTIRLAGDLTLTNGSGTLTPGTSSTFEFDGTANQNIADASAITYNLLKINKASGIAYLTTNLTVGSNFQLESGTFNTSASNYSLTAVNYMLNGGSLVLNNSAMTATGNYINNGTAVSGGTCSLTVSGDYTRNGGSVSCTNYSVFIGGNFINNLASAISANTVTFTGTAKTISGTNTAAFQALSITTGTITLTIDASCTSFTLANNAVTNSFTVNSGKTFTVNGNVVLNQSSAGAIVHSLYVNAGTMTVNGNLTVSVLANNAGRVTNIIITTGTLNITGDLILNNTVLAANSEIDMSGGAGTINLGGNFTINTLMTFTSGTSSTVNFYGSGSQTIPALNYANLTSSGSGARILASTGSIGINGVFTKGTNTYTITGSTIDFNGTGAQTIPSFNYFNLTTSGARTTNSITYSGAIGVFATFSPIATYTTGGRIMTGSTIDFNGTGSQTIPAINYNNLTSSNTGARTLNSSGTIGIFAVFTAGTNTYTCTGSTVNYNGSGAQAVPAIDYNILTFSNAGTKTFSSGTIQISKLTIATGPTFSVTGGSITVTGGSPSFEVNAGGTLSQSGGTILNSGANANIDGTYNQSNGTYLSDKEFNLNSGGVINQSGTGVIHLDNVLASVPSHKIEINPGGVFNQSGGILEVKDFHLLTNNTAVFNQSGTTSLVTIEHDYKNTGGTFNSTGGTIKWTGGSAAAGGAEFYSGTNQFYHVIIDGLNDPGFDDDELGDVKVRGNWTNNNPFLDLVSKVTTVTFNGTVAQTIGGTQSTVFENLTINKASNTLTLNVAASVETALTMTSGIVNTTASNLLTVTATGTTSGASNTSYINGPCKKIKVVSAFTFPIGKGGYLRSCTLSAGTQNGDAFTAEYMRAMPNDTSAKPAGVVRISSCEYWNIDKSGTGSATVELTWDTYSQVVTPANLRMVHWNGSSWDNLNGTPSGSAAAGTLTVTGVSSYSPFTFGSSTFVNPLPVKLISFNAQLEGANARLNWSTALEKNNDHFDIERSKNGKDFDKIGEVMGGGTSMNVLKYTYLDITLPEEANGTYYYRLKQIDFDGSFEYSKIASVSPAQQGMALISSTQPNPFVNTLSVSYYSPSSEIVRINIADAMGRIVASGEKNAFKGMNSLEFNTENWANGIYFINLTYGDKSVSRKMIVKK